MVKAESGTITLDYNGAYKVATKNLYDVVFGPYSDLCKDWDGAKNRSINSVFPGQVGGSVRCFSLCPGV